MVHTTQYDPYITVVRPGVERLTAANASAFKAEVVALIDQGHSQLVMDFSEISFMDSSGLGALVGVLKKIGHRGEMLISGLSSDVEQIFRVCRMDRVFAIHQNVDAAVQTLSEQS